MVVSEVTTKKRAIRSVILRVTVDIFSSRVSSYTVLAISGGATLSSQAFGEAAQCDMERGGCGGEVALS